ncbi:MAG: hypothetical protein N2035_10100 [Chthoniobacterales bacterium]|nr:hypothetical protein [Chthoniobacterales bacterium]
MRCFISLAVLFGLGMAAGLSQNATTVPVGAVRIQIAAGTGTARTTSLISIPLLDKVTGNVTSIGRISSLTSNTITIANASWSPGYLSNATYPHYVRFLSGNASGLMLLISTSVSNSNNTFTINSDDANAVDLLSLGIQTGANGDIVEIYPCETLNSFFGNSTVMGGSSASNSDNIRIQNLNGSWSTYYFNTSLNRWARSTIGNPDATNVPLRPYLGIAFDRLANSSLSLIVTGEVPYGQYRAIVKNSSSSLISTFWPANLTLSQMGFSAIPGWASSTNPNSADKVIIGSKSYFFDGTNWRRHSIGNPIENPTVAFGSALRINRISNDSTGYSLALSNSPY